MRYLPKSPAEREQMLAEIGAGSIDDLFADIPAEYRLGRDLNVPRQQAESEIVNYFRAAAAKNSTGYASFLGAGAYRHYRPVIIDALVQRGEFLTSYTPYQAEITQGTLQAIFEFQTMIAELTAMDVANASMYDGSTGAAEAVMMAARITGRHKAVVARTVHPEYREVLATYAKHQGLPATLLGYEPETGRVDLQALEAAVTEETAAVLVQSPNFFGTIEDIPAIAEIAHARGALLIVSIAEAVSLGVVRPPREADIVSMEAQSFGVALGYGGPYCGVIAAKEQFVRQMPGRLVGQTIDGAGNRGFVLTLATREQHIRREKATSNICTNQALVALMATIFMTVYGKEGMRELAEHNLAKAHYAAQVLSESSGAELLFAGAPHFHEFVLRTKEAPEVWSARLLEENIVGGIDLRRWYPELKNCTLWCATEVITREHIDAAAKVLAAGLVAAQFAMDRQSLEAHWNELRANLLPLRRLLSGEGRAEEMFDDLIDHNELGLALHTICDSLLERERVTIEDGDIEAIEVLHERMQIKDECGEAIRQHRGKNQKAL